MTQITLFILVFLRISVHVQLPANLKAARKKIVLFRRFGFDTANHPDLIPVGLNVATGWADNNADFSITYDPASGEVAYIEDLYQLNGGVVDLSPATKVQQKFDALTSHITNSRGSANLSQVFISFASGFGGAVDDILIPRVGCLIECVNALSPGRLMML